jgi:hypothetical protein
MGIGVVVHAKLRKKRPGEIVLEVSARLSSAAREIEAAACVFALEVATHARFPTVEIGMTTPFIRKARKDLRARATGGSSAFDQVLELARTFEAVHFRWLPRRKTARARWLAARASGVAAKRREHAGWLRSEIESEVVWLNGDEGVDGDLAF